MFAEFALFLSAKSVFLFVAFGIGLFCAFLAFVTLLEICFTDNLNTQEQKALTEKTYSFALVAAVFFVAGLFGAI